MRRVSIPESAWPAEDVQAWKAATSPGKLFEETGVASRWRPKTLQAARYAYGTWMYFLTHNDPSVLALPPASRFTQATVTAYATEMRHRISVAGVAAALGHLILAARAVAPREDWTWLRELQVQHAARAEPPDKRQALQYSSTDLYQLGEALMASAQDLKTARDLRAFRDGLLIAFLASRPLRRNNLASLRLEEHVRLHEGGIDIDIPPALTKNKRWIHVTVPDALDLQFRRYVNEIRPRFLRTQDHPYLWCSNKGGRLGGDAIYHMILRRTKVAFGHAINMHLFRDIAATTLAMEAPQDALLAKDLLGHASFSMTEEHYMHASAVAAGRTYHELVSNLRKARANTRSPQ